LLLTNSVSGIVCDFLFNCTNKQLLNALPSASQELFSSLI